MSATPTKAGIASADERDRLLGAMAACCAKEGYGATTLDVVLEQAGLDLPSFERHFEGKEDCALAALNRIVSETLAAAAADSSEIETERRLFQIRAILALTDARPSFARLGYVEARHGGTERMHATYVSATHVLALMMDRAGGSRGAAPEAAARAALGGMEAVVRRALSKNGDGELCPYLPDFVYAALVPFVGQREALRQSRAAAALLAKED